MIPIASLRHEMKVRAIGLEQFGLNSLADGAPLSDLEAKLLPLYLHHRYQLQAAVKTLGGVRYTYAVKDGETVRPSSVAPVEPAERQRAALDAVLATLDTNALVLPDRLLDLIPPQAFNRPDGTAERFTGKAGLVFDPVAAAVTAADFAVSGLLNPQRGRAPGRVSCPGRQSSRIRRGGRRTRQENLGRAPRARAARVPSHGLCSGSSSRA